MILALLALVNLVVHQGPPTFDKTLLAHTLAPNVKITISAEITVALVILTFGSVMVMNPSNYLRVLR